ncbi:MAG: hypothetical protein ACKOTB_16450 [Planctomycetia bacterium]
MFRPSGFRRLAAACLFTASAVAAAAAAEPALPLEKVVLFTSGVGFFQHGGQVVDDARVEMAFKAEQINDLLKSMVLEDLGGGTVPAVSYASRDPITKTLGTFAVNLTDDPSIGQMLGRLRGARIEVEAAAPTSGVIVGVERRAVAVGEKGTLEKEYVTLLTAEGLRTMALESITRLRFLDERLQAELDKALAVLALGTDNERKSVTIAFAGKGARRVRVGYVQESPVWKTSYRVVLDDAAAPRDGERNRRGLLQGWAIVENTTDQDWKDVRMALVSGRPISFRMDLYQPLSVPRPEVVQQLYASLVPQIHGQDLALADGEFAEAAGRADVRRLARDEAMAKAAAAPMPAAMGGMGGMGGGGAAADMGFAGGAVRSVAEGGDLGGLFRYEIVEPVSIGRQRSAMLPIVAERIEAERVSIYDEQVLDKHPLAGLRLVNSTRLNLMHGPLTVYEAGAYAGDAQIEDMAPGSERLVSYAVDLDVEVNPREEPQPERIVTVRLVKGTLVVTRTLVRRKVFEVRNSGDEEVKLLVEHPREEGWNVVTPEKAAETTRDRHRFAVAAEPGKPVSLEVTEERQMDEHLAVMNTDDDTILFFTSAQETSPQVKQALEAVVERKREIARLVQERTRREQEVQTVAQEQDRIRQNMAQLDRTSELYTRYVQKFAAQETRVETLRQEIAELGGQEQKARQALDERIQAWELN